MTKRDSRRTAGSFAAALLGLLMAQSLVAGTTGQLSGLVVDSDNSPLPGVSVAATSPSQIGGAQLTRTDERGRFLYPRLAPGSYTVRFDADGFVSQELTGVLVRLDREWQLPRSYELGLRVEF